jgi:hypothetical protein
LKCPKHDAAFAVLNPIEPMIRTGKQRDRQTVRFYQIGAVSSYKKKKWKPPREKEKRRKKPHRPKPEEEGESFQVSD